MVRPLGAPESKHRKLPASAAKTPTLCMQGCHMDDLQKQSQGGRHHDDKHHPSQAVVHHRHDHHHDICSSSPQASKYYVSPESAEELHVMKGPSAGHLQHGSRQPQNQNRTSSKEVPPSSQSPADDRPSGGSRDRRHPHEGASNRKAAVGVTPRTAPASSSSKAAALPSLEKTLTKLDADRDNQSTRSAGRSPAFTAGRTRMQQESQSHTSPTRPPPSSMSETEGKVTKEPLKQTSDRNVGATSSRSPAVDVPATSSVFSRAKGLPSLNRTMTKLEEDEKRQASNALNLMRRSGHVTHFASRLLGRLKASYMVADTTANAGEGTEDSTDGRSNDRGTFLQKTSSVWSFLAKSVSKTPVASPRHGEQHEVVEQLSQTTDTFSPTLPPSSQGQTLTDDIVHPEFSSPESLVVPKLTQGNTAKCEDLKNGVSGSGLGISELSSSGKHQEHNAVPSHSNKTEVKNVRASTHANPQLEKAWRVDEFSDDFSDENLHILFDCFANRTDYSGNKMMAAKEWTLFFAVFDEHFPGITPDVKKLNQVFNKQVRLQTELHVAYGLEKGEASRGLTFESFKQSLHDTIGHHWHKSNMVESWQEVMTHDNRRA